MRILILLIFIFLFSISLLFSNEVTSISNIPRVKINNMPPPELSSFTAVATLHGFVYLQWTTEYEVNNLGFNLYRSNDNNINHANPINSVIIPATNTEVTHNYLFPDYLVALGSAYYYWLQMVKTDGPILITNYVMVTTLTFSPPVIVPSTFLENAYPNPFKSGSATNIVIDVKTGETATLNIYNTLGQIVRTYILSEGCHNIRWDGSDYKGKKCSCGIYIYKLISPTDQKTKKMMIVK
jgi:hypothetical protein